MFCEQIYHKKDDKVYQTMKNPNTSETDENGTTEEAEFSRKRRKWTGSETHHIGPNQHFQTHCLNSMC